MPRFPRGGRLGRAAARVAARAVADGVGLAAAGAGLAAVPALVGADLLAESSRASLKVARAAAGATAAVAGSSVDLAHRAAVSGVRAVGTVVTGADPLPGGHLSGLGAVVQGMVERPAQRHRPRVWAQRGRVQVELPTDVEPGLRGELRRRLERLDGVQWATVNDVVGRVLVAFDERRVRPDDVVGAVAAVQRTRGGAAALPPGQDHPADLEPLLAALVSAGVEAAAVGVASAARLLPVPALTRHATVAVSLIDAQPWLREQLSRRIGAFATGLAFDAVTALLHALTQSPTVPALNAAAALEEALEVRARRQVWCRRAAELCGPEQDAAVLLPDDARPEPLPPGTVDRYRSRLGPTTLAGALGLLALTRRPGRSADLIKALSPRAAIFGRESFAAVLDLMLCRRGILPMDGTAYRRLDRIDTVVVDGGTLCTGPPVVLEGEASAEGWDAARIWTVATRLLDAERAAAGAEAGDGSRLGPPQKAADAPGGQVRGVYAGRRRVGTVTVAAELDPHAEALLAAVQEAGHRLVLTAHIGTREIAGAADQVIHPGPALTSVVRRLQGEGRGVLLVADGADAALLAADVGVAPVVPGRAPAWGADLLTRPGLRDACRLVEATAVARRVVRRSVESSLTANVLGALLAAVGSARYGQPRATTPGKSASWLTLVDGAWSAVRLARRPAPPPSVHTPWHALDPDDVLHRLADLPAEPEPRHRELAAAGRRLGALPVVRLPVRFGRTVAAELSDPLTPVLGAGAAATAILGASADAVLVGSVTVVNALLGAVQRMRAETAMESLLLEQDAAMRRVTDAGTEQVPTGALRVGDVVAVQSGDVVTADARLLEADDLEVDESSLTGESLSVAKSVAATPGAEVADRTCMLFDGTTVVAGNGRAVVVATGSATQAGRAARAAGAAAPPAGVQARLAELTRQVLPLTLAGGAAVTLLSLAWRRPLREAVSAGVAIAVAAVPEGLPLVATVAQQAAARRLSQSGAVVRSARVLEALGRVDTVCFDKTGTLTENRLQVARLEPLGSGDEDEVLRLAAASVGTGDHEAHETDRAVLRAAGEHGVAADGDAEAALPFATDRGFSATLRGGRLTVKGAPEVVLRRCTDAGDAAERVRALAAEGLRVLAVADRAVDGRPDDLDDAATGLTLRGLLGLADTVRPTSAAAVEQLRAAGIRVLVATGDHPQTAAAIAAQAGVPGADRVVTGSRLARASDEERQRLVAEAAVFARLSPEQKVLLVGALRHSGATLAMTGDGVNDAAAIRLADVGVGVAGAESPAARSSADVVLTDLDLTRLVDAVGEGRAMWSRVRDAVAVLVGGNAGEVTFTVLGTALGGRAPLNTRQLLLVNLLTDMFPALAVAVAAPRSPATGDGDGPLADHPLREVLRAGPHRGFTDEVRRLVLVRGAATAAGAAGAWAVGRLTGPRGRAGTMGLAALISTQLGQTAWAGRRSPLVLATAAGSLAVLVAVVSVPGVSRFFGCTPLDPLAWLVVLGWAAAGTAGAELVPRLLATRRA